jgi:hypothetical protein
VPRGTYVHLEDGVEERFQCAPGPVGWRYVADRADGLHTDLTVDSRWCPVRMELRTRDWLVRGGLTGPELLWLRSPAGSGAPPLESPGTTEHAVRAVGFLGDSPGFLVAVARSLRLEAGAQADVRLVRLSGSQLAALTVRQRWRLAEITRHDTDLGPLPVERYEVTDLATGETVALHLAGDVVLEAPGIELTELENPPTLG